MTAPLLIGVDGGGTGCRAAVGTGKTGVIARAEGGPANVATDFDGAVANIMQTVLEALAAAELGEVDLSLSVAHLGLAGADLPRMQKETSAMFPFGQTHVSGDRQTTVAGVLGARDGFVVALGTGTIIARQQGRDIRTVSGWGFDLSDQASGAWLGRNLLRATLNAEDGLDPHSALTRQVSAQLGAQHGIFEFSTTARPGDYAEYAPRIFEAAAAGDEIALNLLRAGAGFVEKGLAALGFTAGAPLSLAGGVGPHYAPYLPGEITGQLIAPEGNALAGAFHLAGAAAQV